MENELKVKAFETAKIANEKRNRIKWIKRILIISGVGAAGLGIYWLYSRFSGGNLSNSMMDYFPSLASKFQKANLSLADKVSSANTKVINRLSSANTKVLNKVSSANTKVINRVSPAKVIHHSNKLVRKSNPITIYSSITKKKKKKKGWPF